MEHVHRLGFRDDTGPGTGSTPEPVITTQKVEKGLRRCAVREVNCAGLLTLKTTGCVVFRKQCESAGGRAPPRYCMHNAGYQGRG